MPLPNEFPLPLRERVRVRGKLLILDRTIPLAEPHGSVRFSDWLNGPYEGLAVAAKESAARDLDPFRTLFLDTETTGLAGGSGTVAFLVGCAFFSPDALHVRQLLMTDYDAESLLLGELAAQLDGIRHLVTYNGKSYDIDLLKTRFALQRMKEPFSEMIHLDLLHAARRIWKTSVPDCRLATLETRVLGVRRCADISSGEIPGLYFDYLASGDVSLLDGVLSHNQIDLLSLAALSAVLNRLVQQGGAGARERLCLGRVYSALNEPEKALDLIGSVVRECGHQPLGTPEKTLYARLLKAAGRHEEALALWEAAAAGRSGLTNFTAYEELAKYYEHRARDPVKALQITDRALMRLKQDKLRFRGVAPAPVEQAFRRRRDRLIVKTGLFPNEQDSKNGKPIGTVILSGSEESHG